MQQLVAMKTHLQQAVARQQQSNMEWQLCITDGVIRLDTPIKTIEELLAFSQASIRYLSPFIGVFKRQPLRFESTSISISFGLTSMIQQRELLKPRNKCFALVAYDDINISNISPDGYRGIIGHLIPLYLRHSICVTGLLHVASFLEYYHTLDDPLSSALVLAMCIDALVSLRHALTYSPIKRRILADTFYDKCKDLLFDLYNDPERKLEVVFTTSFLQTYLRDVTLNNLEAGRLTTVALLLCEDMRNDSNKKITRVQNVILHRHYLHLEASNRFFYMLREGKIDFTLPNHAAGVETLDDEPEKTKAYMMLCNHLFQILGSSYVTTLMGKVNSIFVGQPCEIPLEDLLVFEPFVRETWSSLSAESRLCDDSFDPEAYKYVIPVVPATQLLPFIVLHMFTVVICASTLQPSELSCAESRVVNDVIQSVRKRQISLALNSCKILVHSLEANWDTATSDTPCVSVGVMRYVIYCLEKISRCTDVSFPQDLLDLFKKIVDIKLASVIPAGHEVPPSSSLLVTSLETSKVSPYDIYEQFPFAADAQIVDVMRTSIGQLDQYLVSLH